IKFTPQGGSIRISTANEAPGEVSLVITDSGKGISQDQLQRIFEAFAQGSVQDQRHYGGLGLGLAISAGIVALHGGTIVAGSEGLGKGASFTIRLPTVPNPVKAIPFAVSASSADVPPLRIILVEDHESSREVLGLLLRRAGHLVTTFGNGEEALDFIALNKTDLLICDLGLPGMSGLELMGKLKDSGLTGIALSGYGSDEDMVGTAQAGFSAHLVKPVRIVELKAAIQRVAAAAPLPVSTPPIIETQ
ncbi:MAG: response regulator, partial [Verrucomicrobiaceae bacterium]